jgi:hypothetical protein
MDVNTAAVIIALITAVSAITTAIIAAVIQFNQLSNKVDTNTSLIKEVHDAVAEPSPTTVVDRNIDTSG